MSRRKGRYERRKAKRDERRIQRSIEVGGLDKVFTYHDLYSAGKECCNGVRWKNSTQRFEMHLFSGTAVRRRMLLDQKWKPGGYVSFTLSERGKTRPIDAPRIQDRQIHKVYTQKVLLPLYLPSMIWNNGASLRGKGFEFSKRELRKDLHYHFRRHGREGCIRDPEEIMRLVVAMAESLCLTISLSKSKIIPLTKPFRYCKAKYTLTETGKVIVNGNRDGVKRARRKIKAFYHKIENGEMSYEDLWTSVNGMLAYFESYNDHGRILRLRRLFYSIFGFSPERIENFRERGIKGNEIHCS